MLKAVADENDLSKTTLQHIKSVLSGIFTHAKNEGAFDGENPIPGTRIPANAREPAETYAYNLTEICRILEFLPLLPKAAVATAAKGAAQEATFLTRAMGFGADALGWGGKALGFAGSAPAQAAYWFFFQPPPAR